MMGHKQLLSIRKERKMKRENMKIIVGFCLAMVLCPFWPAIAVEKAEEVVFVRNGFYLGAMFVHNSMNGDFDNTSIYYTDTTIYDVPDVDSGSGYGIVGGWRGNSGSFEIGYTKTTHDTTSTFVDVGDEAGYTAIDLNYKFDVLAHNRFRPYVLLRLGITYLSVEDSASEGRSLEDEQFTGFCFNGGIGMAYYLTPRVAAMGGLIYRWNRYGEVESVELDDSLSESALGATVGIAYTF